MGGKPDPYQPGQRGWVKVKTRETAEALVGAVASTREEPRRLVLAYREGRYLRVAGATHQLKPHQQREIGALLAAARDHHPWPAEMALGWSGSHDKVTVVLVDPTVTVELAADTARDGGRWRPPHPGRESTVRPAIEPGHPIAQSV